jgi:hypothetical protein
MLVNLDLIQIMTHRCICTVHVQPKFRNLGQTDINYIFTARASASIREHHDTAIQKRRKNCVGLHLETRRMVMSELEIEHYAV